MFNIHSRVMPGSTWSVLYPQGLPHGPPSILVTRDYGPRSRRPETDQVSRVATPCSLDLVSPQKGFSPGPLTPRFKRFPPTIILPISFLCVLCVIYSVEPLCETIRRSEDFIDNFPSPCVSLFPQKKNFI